MKIWWLLDSKLQMNDKLAFFVNHCLFSRLFPASKWISDKQTDIQWAWLRFAVLHRSSNRISGIRCDSTLWHFPVIIIFRAGSKREKGHNGLQKRQVRHLFEVFKKVTKFSKIVLKFSKKHQNFKFTYIFHKILGKWLSLYPTPRCYTPATPPIGVIKLRFVEIVTGNLIMMCCTLTVDFFSSVVVMNLWTINYMYLIVENAQRPSA